MKRGRRKGSGYVILRGGIWEARWTVAGKRYSRTTGETDRRKAEARLAEFVAPFRSRDAAETLRALARRVRLAAAGGGSVALAHLWELYDGALARRPVSSTQSRLEQSRLAVFVDWVARNAPAVRTMAEVSPDVAQGFLRFARSRFAPGTFNAYRALLSRVWSILAESAAIDGNPWRSVLALPPDPRPRREMTLAELSAVLGSVSGEMRVLFALGVYTGLRLGDCALLDWGAVDLGRGFIQVAPRKTRRHGTVARIPIPGPLAAVLAETPPARRSGAVVPGLAAIYGTTRMERALRAVFARAGISTTVPGVGRKADGSPRLASVVGFHSLRHTYVSLCANSGVPLAVVQSIVGHTRAAMTAHYFHVSDSALAGAAAALPDVTARAPSSPAPPSTVATAAAVLDRFRAACAALAAAGLSPDEWRAARAAFASVVPG